MLILTQKNPETALYYIGSKVLDVLENQQDELFVSEIFLSINKKNSIAFSRFVLGLDWLYAIGAISTSVEGRIKKCT